MPTLPPPSIGGDIPLSEVGNELARHLDAVKEPGIAPVQWARMSNLIIFCDDLGTAQRVANEVPEVVASHPARVLLLVVDPSSSSPEIRATVSAWCQAGQGGRHICSEQVTLWASRQAAPHLAYAVRGLLIGDLPINLWWAAQEPPVFGGQLLNDLAENAQQIVFDSIGWQEPARGVALTAPWITRFQESGRQRWRVASDLNWRRLKFWRRLIGQTLDPITAPGAIESIQEVVIEHGPHAVVQAWELVGWLASRLKWHVRGGRVEPNVEIVWQVMTPHGLARVRVRRLADGPSDLRRVRFECAVNDLPGALDVHVEDEIRLAARPEGFDGTTRTVTNKVGRLAELVGRQLSDRERDPVFLEAMAVAQVFAQSVLR